MSVDSLQKYLAGPALGDLYSSLGLSGDPAALSPDEVRTELEGALDRLPTDGNGVIRGLLQKALEELDRLAPPSQRPVETMPAARLQQADLQAPQQMDKLVDAFDLARWLKVKAEPFASGDAGNGFYFTDEEGRRFSVRIIHRDTEDEGQPYVWITFMQIAGEGNPSRINKDVFHRRCRLGNIARAFPQVRGVKLEYWRGGFFRNDYVVWIQSGGRMVEAGFDSYGVTADQQLLNLARAMSLFGFLLDKEAPSGLFFRDRQKQQVRAHISHGTLIITQQPDKENKGGPLDWQGLLKAYGKAQADRRTFKPEFLKGIERVEIRGVDGGFRFEFRVEKPGKKRVLPLLSFYTRRTPVPKNLAFDLGWRRVLKGQGPYGRDVYQDGLTGRRYAVYTLPQNDSGEEKIVVEQIVRDILDEEQRISAGDFAQTVLKAVSDPLKGYPWIEVELMFTEPGLPSDSLRWALRGGSFQPDKWSDGGSRKKRSYQFLSPLLPALGLKPMPVVCSPAVPIFVDPTGHLLYASWDGQTNVVVFHAFTDKLSSLPLAAGETVLREEDAPLFSEVKGIRFEEDVKPGELITGRRTLLFLEKVADNGVVKFAAPIISPENAARFLGWDEDDSGAFVDQNGRRVEIEMIGDQAFHFYRKMEGKNEVSSRKEGKGEKPDGEKFAETVLKVLEARFPELETVILTTASKRPGDAEPQVTFKQWRDSPAGFVRISPQTEAVEGMIEAFGFEPDVGENLYRHPQRSGVFWIERVERELFIIRLSAPRLDQSDLNPSDLIGSFNEALRKKKAEKEAGKIVVPQIDRIIYNWRGKRKARTFVLQKVKEKEGVTFREAHLESGLIASLLGGKPLKEADPLQYKNFAHHPGTWYLGPNRCLFGLEVKIPKGLNGRPCLIFTQLVSSLSPDLIDHFARVIIPLISTKLAAVNHVVYRAYDDESGLGDVVPFVRADGRFVRDEEKEDLSGSRRQSMAEEIASMMPGLGLGLDYTFHEGGDLPTFRLNGKPVQAVKAGQELWLIERGKPVLDAGKMKDRFSAAENTRQIFEAIEWIRVVTAGPKADSGTTRFLLAIEERPGLPWPELVEREVPEDQQVVNLNRPSEETGETALPEPLHFPLGGRGAKTARKGALPVAKQGRVMPPKGKNKPPDGKKGPEGSAAGSTIHDHPFDFAQGRQSASYDLRSTIHDPRFTIHDGAEVRQASADRIMEGEIVVEDDGGPAREIAADPAESDLIHHNAARFGRAGQVLNFSRRGAANLLLRTRG